LEGRTHSIDLIFSLWKRLSFKRLILTKNGFRNHDLILASFELDRYVLEEQQACTLSTKLLYVERKRNVSASGALIGWFILAGKS
ncbi:hypothetical protein SFRURICE_020056, partial [Spodoptera frugiperda]